MTPCLECASIALAMTDKNTASTPKQHAGGCHCGNVRYTVTGSFDSAISCNCSMCGRKGTLLSFVPADAFTLEKGDGALTDYQFNHQVIHHLFCSKCGVTSFARGKNREGQPTVAINVRCLDDFDIDAMKITPFDGKSR
jgi:hypothetical protein